MEEAGDARNAFAVRYYRWALHDMEREIDQGLPLLRSIQGSLAMRAVDLLESIDAGERRRVATVLVKRGHRKALEIAGDGWGEAETSIDTRIRDALRAPSPREAEYNDASLHNPSSIKVSRAALLSAVTRTLTPVLGTPGAAFSTKREWRFATSVGEWTLVTLVDTGGSTHQLAYMQTIQADDRRRLQEGISILSWTGIGGANTQWNRLTAAGIDAAAGAAAAACERFLHAAPELLQGLTP
jgi:hypothetical protein